jgi:L-aminopeptidase/D-esterase-like protein
MRVPAVPARSILDVPGLLVGNDTDRENLTGCTVVLCPGGAVAAVDVRGGAPGTRETDLLAPGRLVQQVHAILLTGGSAFGLAAADGVMRFLNDRGYGHPIGQIRVPIVPAAVIFDLGIGSSTVYPDASSGWRAAIGAGSDTLEEGSVGAGTGATVGKVLGMQHATKGGLGSAALALAGDVVVGALVVVNALGDVVNPLNGQIIAGARDPAAGGFVSAVGQILRRPPAAAPPDPPANTTIGVVATNARLTRDALVRAAALAQDGLARTIRPAHTLYDGDTIFALATGRSAVDVDPVAVSVAAAEVVATAIVRAVTAATSLGGIPSASELTQAGG